jgi:hypothetical protein
MNITEVRSTVGNQAKPRLEAALDAVRQLKYAYVSASVDLDGIRGNLKATLDLIETLESLEKKFTTLEIEAQMLLDMPAIKPDPCAPAGHVVFNSDETTPS